ELEPGERPLWASAAHFRPASLGAREVGGWAGVPVLVVVAILCFANGMGHFGPLLRANDAAPIFIGIVSSMLAFALAAGAFANGTNRRVERRRMANTCYAVTDQRAILWVADPKTDAVRVISIHRGDISYVVRAELPDGSGDLEISPLRYVGHVPWH